ncbi:hypothetical protein DFJ74DRAFT_657119 [Hyaloraphidium curvatum]|nr:hypothetical protein DFJ74DRAFT_657119 [Hyaloraphidium curvatum]
MRTLFLLLLLATLLAASSATPPTCCRGCLYAGGCCCPARPPGPTTATAYSTTRVRTVTVTATRSARAARRGELSPTEPHALLERTLCLTCPPGAGSGEPCCPAARSTRTTTVPGTTTKVVTRTVSMAPWSTIRARVFYDSDSDGGYKRPPDSPISNSPFELLRTGARSARGTVISTGRTDGSGMLALAVPQLPIGTRLGIFRAGASQALESFTAGSGPGTSIAVSRPPRPTIDSTVVSANVAMVSGSGAPRLRALLLANGTTVAQTRVPASRAFVLRSSNLTSGTYMLSVVLRDLKGADSLPAPAGIARIPLPPKVASTILNNNKTLTVSGTALANALVTLRSNTTLQLGSTTASSNGSYRITTPSPPPLGINELTVVQTTPAGTSDPSIAGNVPITLPGPPEVFGSPTVSGNQATVEGLGEVGATVQLFSNGTEAASARVRPDAQYSVTATLPVGTNILTIRQVDLVGPSKEMPAGTAVISA